MEHPEIDLHIYGQLLFDEDAKAIMYRKESLQQMMQKKIGYLHVK